MKFAATSHSPLGTHSGSSGRELHDRVLAGLVQPSQFLQGSLLEDVWLVRTDDEEGRRNATVTLRFDSPVSPGPELLSEDIHSSDLLTLKLAVLYALDAQRGWANAAHSLPQYLSGLLVLTRWRNAQGIRRLVISRPPSSKHSLAVLSKTAPVSFCRSKSASISILQTSVPGRRCCQSVTDDCSPISLPAVSE